MQISESKFNVGENFQLKRGGPVLAVSKAYPDSNGSGWWNAFSLQEQIRIRLKWTLEFW